MQAYGTARFKLQERTCVQVHVHVHDTGIEIFAKCLRVHGLCVLALAHTRVMDYWQA